MGCEEGGEGEGRVVNPSRTTTHIDASKNNARLTMCIKIPNDPAELLLCRLVEVIDGDTSSEDGIVGMGGGDVGGRFRVGILWRC